MDLEFDTKKEDRYQSKAQIVEKNLEYIFLGVKMSKKLLGF